MVTLGPQNSEPKAEQWISNHLRHHSKPTPSHTSISGPTKASVATTPRLSVDASAAPAGSGQPRTHLQHGIVAAPFPLQHAFPCRLVADANSTTRAAARQAASLPLHLAPQVAHELEAQPWPGHRQALPGLARPRGDARQRVLGDGWEGV